MRANVMYGAGDVRTVDVPDSTIVNPADAIVRVARSSICGSDLWPYRSMERSETGQSMGHEAIGVVEAVGRGVHKVKVDELLPDVLEGRIEPGRVFDLVVDLDGVPDGYRAMDQRKSVKVMINP